MPDPLSWLGALSAKYGPTAAGLAIGTAAKYGLTINEGRPLTWRGVCGDLLLQGALGLIAIAIGDVFGLTGNARVFAGALAALNSDRLVRLARDTFFKRVEADSAIVLGNQMKAAPATIAEVPAGHGEPEAVQVQAPTGDSDAARAGSALRRAFSEQRTPADMTDQLRQLGDDF